MNTQNMETPKNNFSKGENKKIIIPIIVGVIIIIGALALFNVIQNKGAGTLTGFNDQKKQPVKEFIMQSFVVMDNGQPKPQFSLKEMTVNKGDLVRIKITVTAGGHDFKIDEYNVYADTQLNQEYAVEFTADKAGEFVYYCTKPGHRALGHWGTLKVI